MSLLAQSVPGHRADDVVDVFCDAFHNYPVMRVVVGPLGDVEARLRRLIGFFVRRRIRRGGPMVGVVDGGVVVGAAILTLPAEPDPPPDVAAMAEEIWQELGRDARERYEVYAQATKAFAMATPHHHLNMIGVRGSHAGRRLARPLLEAVRQMAIDDPNSSGVSLTTELAKNVTLYEHFGYRVIGHVEVAPGLESWGLFLETQKP